MAIFEAIVGAPVAKKPPINVKGTAIAPVAIPTLV
jgi:hypothetical protein